MVAPDLEPQHLLRQRQQPLVERDLVVEVVEILGEADSELLAAAVADLVVIAVAVEVLTELEPVEVHHQEVQVVLRQEPQCHTMVVHMGVHILLRSSR